MSLLVLASQAPVADVKPVSAYFAPGIWGDHFLSYATMEVDIKLEQQVRTLKEEVKKMLHNSTKKPSHQLQLVDDIQRLGVSYHFEYEIDEILKHIHQNYSCGSDDDLYTTALHFRLLRQHGYKISCDVFKRFKEENGQTFKQSLLSDVRGLLSLYEAAHLMIHEEDILEEALDFTTTHLKSIKHGLSPLLSKQVEHSLNQPLRRSVNRVEARYYLSIYHECDSHDETLLTFAKLDFNLVQQGHQNELCELTRWWKKLDVEKNLPFIKDRVTEVYFIWVLSMYFEPQYSFGRMASSKISSMLGIMDDIYDTHGTLEELELFTEAIQRWDIGAINSLPRYMQFSYKTMLDIYTEIEEELAKKGHLHRIHCLKEDMKMQVKYYFQEAKWLRKKHIPTMDEYMDLSVLTTAYHMLLQKCFIFMGDIATLQDSLDWLATYPSAVRGAAAVCRLMDDIVDYKFERNRGTVTSAVECYMKEYGASEEEAISGLRKLISNAWKDINESFFLPNAIPRPLLTRVLGLACGMDVAYKHEDGYTTHHGTVLKDFVVSTLVQSVPV